MAKALHGRPAGTDGALTAKAKLCVADFLACALSSRDLPWGRQAIALARRRAGSNGPAGIIGTPYSADADAAAFANAVLGHGLVRDDMHLGSVSHLGAVVIPTVLALAAERPVRGAELLAAIAVGYEAGGRLGRCILDVEVSRIFRPSGITGPIAAAAAAASLLRLDPPAFSSALALAANTAAGYNEWAATGGTEMFFHPGFAARNGLMAVELAADGAFISPSALDGPAGMLRAFGKAAAPDTAMPFADRPEILAVFFKEVPACNFAQTPAQVARDLAAGRAIDTADVERVTVRVSYAAAHYPGCDRRGPFEHLLQAKMSIQYNVAAALIHGDFDEANYLPAEQRETIDLAQRVDVEIDPALTAAYPSRQGASVTVRTRSGDELGAAADDVLPAADGLVIERLAAVAAERLGGAGAERLLAHIDALDTAADAGDLVRLTQAAAGR